MNIVDANVSKFRNFINVYETLKFLCHPNIVKTYGIFLSDDSHPPLILMEFCLLNIEIAVKHLTLSNVDVSQIIYEVAEAMKYAHKRYVIHRYLKPSNVLIGMDKHVRISDFGLSELMTIEEQNMVFGVGTQKFMAPEILNEINYDEKVDVYSFGVLAFFIISGGMMPKITVVQMRNGKKAEIPSNFTDFAKNLIDRCWNFEPETRPSFEEIVNELEANNYDVVNLSSTELKEVKMLINENKNRLPKY